MFNNHIEVDSLAQPRSHLDNMVTYISEVKRRSPQNKEERDIVCPYHECYREFKEVGNLKTHIRTHTRERPFKCSHCDVYFFTNGHKKAHEQTHIGTKPYVCTFSGCEKKYSRQARLKDHILEHVSQYFSHRQY